VALPLHGGTETGYSAEAIPRMSKALFPVGEICSLGNPECYCSKEPRLPRDCVLQARKRISAAHPFDAGFLGLVVKPSLSS
jgi:hypothetical protein